MMLKSRDGRELLCAESLKEYEVMVSAEYGDIVLSPAVERDPFSWTLLSRQLGWMQISRVHASNGFAGARRARSVRDGREHLILMLVEDGMFWLEQHRRDACVGPNSLVLMDGNAALDAVQTGPTNALAFKVPTGLLKAQNRAIETGCATAVDANKGCAAVLRDLMRSIWDNQDDISEAELQALPSSLLNLVGLVFVSEEQGVVGKASTMQIQVERIRAAIRAELDNPELSPIVVAARLGISRSYLHAAMQWAGTTFGRVVMDMRLEQCRATLADPAAFDRSILDIALGWGFQNPSHFSRRFVERYGRTPGQYRTEILSNLSTH